MERIQSYAFSSYACPIRDIPRRAACARRLVAVFIFERKSLSTMEHFLPSRGTEVTPLGTGSRRRAEARYREGSLKRAYNSPYNSRKIRT
jgi:hypothetical protein